MGELTWVACEARTGAVIERLPGMECRQVGVTLCRYESAEGLRLPLPTAPPEWERALLAGGSVLVLTDDDRPVWGGLVLRAPRVAESDVVEVTASTVEVYLARRFVGDADYGQDGADLVGQNLIVKDLVERFVADGPNGGIPIRVEVVGGGGRPRERHYTDSSNKTVYEALRELAQVEGGPEWTVGWERSVVAGRVHYTPVMYVGDRIGAVPAPGFGPAAVYRLPGALRSAVQDHDYRDGKGANHVTAWSSGQDEARPAQSWTMPDPDRPTWEHRWSPSTSIVDEETLLAHARRKATDLAGGGRALALVADYAARPRLGMDWDIGDVIGYQIGGTTSGPRQVVVEGDAFTEWAEETAGSAAVTTQVRSWETVPAFPGGLRGQARALGWRLVLDGVPTIQPILVDEGSEG